MSDAIITISTSGSEQRMTFRLLSYWNRVRGSKSMPSLSDINIQEIPEVYHFTFTIALGADESEHSFQYFGPELASVFGQDYTGYTLQEALNDVIVNNTIGFYDKVMAEGKPHSESSEFFSEGREVRYRSIILPLSSNGETIDFLIGTTNYKIF